MYRLQWYVIVALLPFISALNCPKGQGCSNCLGRGEDEYELTCHTSDPDSYFEVTVNPREWITIKCINSPNWTEFHLGVIPDISGAESLSFERCELPESEELGEIARQIGASHVTLLKLDSNNKFTLSLTRNIFTDFANIRELMLPSNGLVNLTDDLLQDLRNLTLLDLRGNNLSELPQDFLNLPNLKSIELGGNHLEVIEPAAFDKPTKLLLLNLWNNKLVEIKPASFDKLESLRTLDLHRNQLTSLPDNIFAKLPNLRRINLSQNNFTRDSLQENLLWDNSLLQEVKFFENKQNLTTLPSKFFANLKNLTMVVMRRNGLVRLPEDLFAGASNLSILQMERNYIEGIPRLLFQDCTNLSNLDLSGNKLRDLPDDVFSMLTRLEFLNLSKNHITTISEKAFTGLQSLRELNLQGNGLRTIHPQGLNPLKNLQIAKFSDNQLTLRSNITVFDDYFGPKSPFHDCMDTIEVLELSHNNISVIFSEWILALKLKQLDLSYNSIELLQEDDFQFLSDEISVDLSWNKIERVILRTLEIFSEIQPSGKDRNNPERVTITIENNPINCDCDLYDLLRYREKEMHPIVYTQFTLEMGDLRCDKPSKFQNSMISTLNSKSFECSLDEPEMYNASCPNGCDCRVRPENGAYIIDCSNASLMVAPGFLEMPSGLDIIELNLTGNFLSEMPPMTLKGYESVKMLDLSNNRITDLPLTGVSRDLEFLYLDRNNLRRLDPRVMDFFMNSTNLRNLTLQGNPWIADCGAREFLSFVQSKMLKIPELQKVKFEGSAQPVFEMTPDELCPPVIGWVIGVCIGIAALGVIFGGLAAFYYRYQHEIKVWLYARGWCLWFVSEDELDKDKLYDAFISYSHKDQEFVENTLVPRLENGPKPFKVCVHYRDWKAGQLIPANIARSVENARRTVVVLSPDFLESVWGRMEFRTAHLQALSEGRARVIVILYRDIGPINQLEPELKAYLSMNTYIQWGDPWFWDKLNYALPHPEDLLKKKKKSTIFANQRPGIQMANDKTNIEV